MDAMSDRNPQPQPKIECEVCHDSHACVECEGSGRCVCCSSSESSIEETADDPSDFTRLANAATLAITSLAGQLRKAIDERNQLAARTPAETTRDLPPPENGTRLTHKRETQIRQWLTAGLKDPVYKDDIPALLGEIDALRELLAGTHATPCRYEKLLAELGDISSRALAAGRSPVEPPPLDADDVLYLRCMEHQYAPQINSAASGKSECGECIRLSVTNCDKHYGLNQYCSICLAECAEKVAIGARRACSCGENEGCSQCNLHTVQRADPAPPQGQTPKWGEKNYCFLCINDFDAIRDERNALRDRVVKERLLERAKFHGLGAWWPDRNAINAEWSPMQPLEAFIDEVAGLLPTPEKEGKE
jgi:hypothetical protein